MSKFLKDREKSLLLIPIQPRALLRRVLEIHPLPQIKRPEWYREGKTRSHGRGAFSSYSSGMQIKPLPESVVTDHFRQVCSFSTAGEGLSGNKENGKMRSVIDLSVLNQHLIVHISRWRPTNLLWVQFI